MLSGHICQMRSKTMLKIPSNQSITSNVAHAKLSTCPPGDANYWLSLRIGDERIRDATINGGRFSRSTVNKQFWSPVDSGFRMSLCFVFVFPQSPQLFMPDIIPNQQSPPIDPCVMTEDQGIRFSRKIWCNCLYNLFHLFMGFVLIKRLEFTLSLLTTIRTGLFAVCAMEIKIFFLSGSLIIKLNDRISWCGWIWELRLMAQFLLQSCEPLASSEQSLFQLKAHYWVNSI